MHVAMQSVTDFALAKHEKMHVEKVNEFIREREAAHPDAPRILYGIGNPGLIKDYETGMNREAFKLIKDTPKLMIWANGQWRKAALTEAARIALYASGYKLVKGFSKAGGLAGEISPRGSASKAALDSPGLSKLASSPEPTSKAAFNSISAVEVKARVSAALRNSEIDLLPMQIADLEKKIETTRALRDDYSRRAQQSDLFEALKLGRDIDTMQHEVPSCMCILARAPSTPDPFPPPTSILTVPLMISHLYPTPRHRTCLWTPALTLASTLPRPAPRPNLCPMHVHLHMYFSHLALKPVRPLNIQVAQKKILLREYVGKKSKASSDKLKNSHFATVLSSATSSANLTLPEEVTELALSLPNVPIEEREQTVCLARQLNVTAAFARASTWVAGGTSMCRVSPLFGISLKQYICSAKHLATSVQYDCQLLIAACAALDKEEGHLSLKELWQRIHGPTGSSSAQQKIDLLMRAPLVAVRVASSDSVDGSWIITAKSDDTNYASFGGLVATIERPSILPGKIIPKSRLQALKQLASTPADARLIDLAALDTTSARAERVLSGRKSEGSVQRKEREQKMQVALETYSAYKDLASVDTIAEIKAILNCGDDEITDEDLCVEMDKLRAHDEELSKVEEEAMLDSAFVSRPAQYDLEDVDKELIDEIELHDVLDCCTEKETDELASRLQGALHAEGLSVELDGQSLSDPGKQEELAVAFGEGWTNVLRFCLEEPAHPPPDDDDEAIDDLDDPEPLLSLEAHAHSMVLSLRRELGIPGADVEEDGEARTSSDIAEHALLSALSPRELVTKLVARNRRQRERQASASKEVAAARRSLAGETGRAPCLDTVLGKWPDIGDKIEAICADLGVGADAKRRDGALTMNSAVNRGKGGVGFVRILLELTTRHGIQISARALRDLCTAKDRRTAVSRRYKDVVNLRYRRSVKRIGQDNLDDHKQNAKYKYLHYLRDSCEFDLTLWFQRDDHAKVRGGSSESTRGSSVSANGEGVSALQHDYMNPELSSPLYASSLLVSGCADGGGERCLALVKAEKLAPSTPSQHYSDFYMLQERARTDPELKSIFFTAAGKVKPKVQLEVDGGADEDPTKRETRFLQTELLMGGPSLDKEQRRAQVGTDTREAGAHTFFDLDLELLLTVMLRQT